MKILQAFLLSSLIASCGITFNLFGMEQEMMPLTLAPQTIQNDAKVFFSHLNVSYGIDFTHDDKNIVIRLFSACQSNDISEINKIVTLLNKNNNANELVCATLFFATYNCSDIVAKNLLATKSLRVFIFRAFLPADKTNALNFLKYTVDCCVQFGHFQVLTFFINKILLRTLENDKHTELPQGWNTSYFLDFVEDRENSFKDALKLTNEQNDKILHRLLDQLGVTLDESNDQSDSENENGETSDLNLSDQDYDDDSAECSSDKDSDGECSHSRGWQDHIEYMFEHMDQVNVSSDQ